MSYLVKPMQLDFLNNKDRENVFISNDDPDNSFNFKYVSTSQFKNIMKDVKRQRTQKKEERVWASLIHHCNLDRSDYDEEDRTVPGISNLRRFVRNNTKEIDQELKRLKEDALPERMKRLSNRISINEKRAKEAKKMSKSCGKKRFKEDRVSKSLVAPLATDEDTGSASSLERSPVSKLEYSTITRKSQSECTLRARSESDDEFRCSLKNSEYNSCTERSEDYESEKEHEIREIRPHPQVAHKILVIQKKISNLLDEISFRLNRIPLPDGDDDLRRRQQCVMEFAIRFSRNYLYDLGRQIADIRRHVRAVSPNARLKPSRRGFSLHVQAIEQKLTSAHQLLLQALNAYCKHIPSSVLKGQPGKLKEILQIVVDLRDICTKIHLTTDYFERGDVEPPPLGKDIQGRCSTILSKLRLSSDNESQTLNRSPQSTPIEGYREKSNNKNDGPKGVLPSRLSMYNTNTRFSRKSHVNRKLVKSCTREKRSSNHISTIPQRFHPTTPELSNTSPVTHRIIKEIPQRNRAKIRLPVKEDEISTMMSILPTESEAGSSIAISEDSRPSMIAHKESSSKKNLSKNASLKNTKYSNPATEGKSDENLLVDKSNTTTDKELSRLVPVIADLMTLVRNNQSDVAIRPVSTDSMRVMTEFLTKYRSSIRSDNSVKELITEVANLSSIIKNDENSQNPVIETNKIKRIGPKNMQLVCLPAEEEKCDETTNGTFDSPEMTNEALRNKKNNILRINESALEELLKYREEFHDWAKSNPMYTSKSENKPWDVVAWIADKLVDELIIDVSKEFEIPGVVQKLFELEFKEF